MKQKLSLIVILGISIIACAGISYSQSNEIAVVNRFIARQAAREKGEEYLEARKILSGDVNGDKESDLVVLYTLESFGGNNNYIQYLAVFLRKGNSFRYTSHTVVGGRCRNISLESITHSKINLNTKECRKNDPPCCPTKPGKAHYVFSVGKLKEIK